jgi:hypothetical protein
MFQTKVVEKIKTHFLFSNFFYENRAVYEIMWENIVERGRSQMAIWRMRIGCWIPKATNTHTQIVLLSHCFNVCTKPRQRYLIQTSLCFLSLGSNRRDYVEICRVDGAYGPRPSCVRRCLLYFHTFPLPSLLLATIETPCAVIE